MALLDLYREMWLRLRISYYELALSQIDVCHPDVPHIVRMLMRLSDQLKQLKVVRYEGN